VEEAYYTALDADRYMSKLDGLVAANDPTTIARYVADVAAVVNSPSIQDTLSGEQRRTVSHSSLLTNKLKPRFARFQLECPVLIALALHPVNIYCAARSVWALYRHTGVEYVKVRSPAAMRH